MFHNHYFQTTNLYVDHIMLQAVVTPGDLLHNWEPLNIFSICMQPLLQLKRLMHKPQSNSTEMKIAQ